MDKIMNQSSIPFYWILSHEIYFNDKKCRLIIFKSIIILIIILFTTLCNASDQKVDSLKKLIDLYDPTGCRECHEEIYTQWQNSHHARSITGTFMERYLKKGPLSVKSPEDATKKNFPCFKCHLPQLEKATDAVASELASVILNNDKTTMQKLNISCMVCHQDKGVVHGLPESNIMYGPKAEKEYPEEEHMRVNPIQCATLYGSYLHAYIPSGGAQTCQECHMKEADHTCPPNFNERKDVSDRLRQALPMEVSTLSYRFQPFENRFVPIIILKTKITSSAGHRIPDG